jgi:LCP family protein required for cell wall assembly
MASPGAFSYNAAIDSMRDLLRRTSRPRVLLAGGLVLVVLALVSAAAWMRFNPAPKVILGRVPLDEELGETDQRLLAMIDRAATRREPPPPSQGRPPAGVRPSSGRGAPSGGARGLWPPNGRPPGPARPFSGTVDDSGGLLFGLVLGTDARSGNPANARADSIHILALDPKARRGTVIGIPRDSWVDIPGHGHRKINDSVVLGGPELAVRTLRNLTGLPITYYAMTAFEGMRALVNDLGGVDAFVPYDMNDHFSGAFFQRGWHRMDGERALAFSRNRHIPGGDFGRSENQGRLMLDVLRKARAETSTPAELEPWVQILVRHTRVNMSFAELMRFAVLARVTADSSVRNVVAPGRTGTAGRASVVYLTEQATALFRDVADDAVADGSYSAVGPPDPQAPAPQGDTPAPPPEPAPEPACGPLNLGC